MGRAIIDLVVRFALLVLVQVLLLNNVHINSMLNPYLYLYVLIVLPVDFSPNLGLFFGFLLGLCVDIFSQTLGMHTVATVFAAFCRPYLLRYMAPRDGYEFSRVPGIRQMGWPWFITYAGLLILLHHFVLFFVETFRMSGFWFTLSKSIGSAGLTLTLAVVVQLLFARALRPGSGYE